MVSSLTSDEFFIRYCLKLAEKSLESGEWPFSCVIVKEGKIIAESINGVHKHTDISSHAEILAMKITQKLLNTHDLSDCDIYSNCEPCAMCSLVIRELKFKKVVFSVASPYIGGYSKWNILQDDSLTELEPDFNAPPEIVTNVLHDEALAIFKKIGWGKMFGI